VRSRMARRIGIGLVVLLLPVIAAALFTNGGFETGDFTGWTKEFYYNPGLAGSPPFDGSDIVRSAGGYDESIIVTAGAPETGVDPQLGASASLKYPKYETYAARVNGPQTGAVGNTIRQQSVVTAADVDPVDGQVHVRFVYAPVMEDPQHAPDEQPYFYVRVYNVSTSTTVFESLRFSNEPGVPWKTSPLNSYVLYTDWQIVDIPGGSLISVGDTVEVEITAADCSLSGHFGYVYVDGIGSFLPGLSIAATTDATSIWAGANITYNITYRNTGGVGVTGTTVQATLPPLTAFASLGGPDGGSCSEAGGVVTCNFGDLAHGDGGSFTLTLTYTGGDPAATHLNFGNYSIEADAVSPTLGPLVSTPVALPIPTLSQWALILLGLAFVGFAVFRLMA
jgi:uncharacterized repeat protein (TIGR01451 family)